MIPNLAIAFAGLIAIVVLSYCTLIVKMGEWK
jgi:hypothetical protein